MKDFIKKHLPNQITDFISSILDKIRHFFFLIEVRYRQPHRYKRISKKILKKDKIKVAFFIIDRAVWKLDYLYWLLDKHPRFEPIIVVCPMINYGKEVMISKLKEATKYIAEKQYKYAVAYNIDSDKYIDISHEINPDIVFYTNPYKGLIDDRYYIDNFLNVLTCYVPYYYGETKDYNFCLNLPLHNLVWNFYLEGEYYHEKALKHMDTHGKNTCVTGYPGVDQFLDKTYHPTEKWKSCNKKLKRIIWAPHHTIEPDSTLGYSSFLSCADFMIEMARKYENQIQIAFKPHPILRAKLELIWTKKDVDDYYEQWNSMPNTQLETGEYIDLFLTSDAMIHDSGSFLIEYLYTRKPVMRTIMKKDYKLSYNEFAMECMNYYYKAYTNEDIDKFIQMIINDEDPLKDQRDQFYKKRLLPKDNKLPSENILNNLVKELEIK